MLLLLYFTLVLHYIAGAEVELTVAQDNEDDLGSVFSFKCTVEDYEDKNIASIIIYRQTLGKRAAPAAPREVVAFINRLTPTSPVSGPGFKNIGLQGQIDFESTPETYLEALLTDLRVEDLGVYTCEVALVDEDGEVTFSIAEAKLAARGVQPDLSNDPEKEETSVIEESVQVEETTLPVEDTTLPVEAIALPVEETTLPVEETTLPVEETTLPAEETTLPVEETTLPVVETTIPVEETTPPVEETTLPVEETTLPVEETTLPVEETTLPVEETTLHVEETTLPVEETTLPVEETTLPVEETTIPVDETTLPVEETTLPVEETTLSVEETTLPVEETTLPVEETTLPFEETTLPVEETTLLVEETTLPVEETTLPVEETKLSENTTDAGLDDLVLAVESLGDKLDAFNETVVELKKKLLTLDDKETKDTVTDETTIESAAVEVINSSFVYENASYVFFKANQVIDAERAQAECERRRFFLTEVNSDGELKAIADEVSPYVVEEGVILVGGHKIAETDVWLYQGSKQQVDFFAWGPGESVQHPDSGCLALRKLADGQLNMVSLPCSNYQSNFYFLCEHDD